MQRTLILLKPDAIEHNVGEEVTRRLTEAGFRETERKEIQLTPELLREHYAHIADKPFYPEVEKFMMSTPVIAMVWEGEGIIESTRKMLGATDCTEAAPGTIRAEFGSKEPSTCKMMNIAHASDSNEAAKAEIARFFS